jgi:hypothetical protein
MAATMMVMLMLRQHSSESTPPAIASIHQANHCSRSIAQPPTQRRSAGSQSPAAEASLLQSEFRWHLSDTPCIRNTVLLRAHDTSLVTARTVLEIWSSSGPPQWLTGYCTLCLRNTALSGATSCRLLRTLPAYLYTQLTETDIYYSVTWLSLWASTCHKCLSWIIWFWSSKETSADTGSLLLTYLYIPDGAENILKGMIHWIHRSEWNSCWSWIDYT